MCCMRLRSLYIPNKKFSKKFSFGVLYPYRCTDGVKFSMAVHAEFHRHRCNELPLWGEKHQNRPLSN